MEHRALKILHIQSYELQWLSIGIERWNVRNLTVA